MAASKTNWGLILIVLAFGLLILWLVPQLLSILQGIATSTQQAASSSSSTTSALNSLLAGDASSSTSTTATTTTYPQAVRQKRRS
jgi:hypothetical protein